jgi:hypothetical protein
MNLFVSRNPAERFQAVQPNFPGVAKKSFAPETKIFFSFQVDLSV